MEPIARGEEIVAEFEGKSVMKSTPLPEYPCCHIMTLSNQFTRDEADVYRESVSTWSLIAEIREITDPRHM